MKKLLIPIACLVVGVLLADTIKSKVPFLAKLPKMPTKPQITPITEKSVTSAGDIETNY